MIRPSGSRTALGLACQWPWTAAAQPWPAEEAGPAAERGTRMHARAASIVDPRAPAVGPLADAEEEAGAQRMAQVVVGMATAAAEGAQVRVRTEVALAYRPALDHALGIGEHMGRDYSRAPEGSRCMSLDAMWVVDDKVYVVDWKTGQAAHVEPARDNAQLATGALAAARHYGVQHALVALVFEDGRVDSHELDVLDLDAHAARLRANDAALDRGDPTPTPGGHCGYCPARLACPATQAAVAEALPELAQPAGMLDPIQSHEDAAQRVVRLRMVRDAWERAEAQVDALLREWTQAHGPIPLGGGKVRRLVSATRETIQWTAEEKERAKAEGRVKVSTYQTWKDGKTA